ncbi:MAG TPA: dipeptidase [bacterium]|nr:dipeptidase [bacterium]
MGTTDAGRVHGEAIVIDGTCPLANREEFLDEWIRGGATAIAPSLEASTGVDGAMRSIARWLTRIAAHPDKLLHVTRAADVNAAKAQGRLGIIFHFQGTEPLADDLDLLTAYARLGVRVVQLTYNRKNRVGDGCEERTDAGLSRFGVRVIQEMNRLGLIVDLAHTGYRTTMEAMETSSAPPIFSHANCRAVCDSPRNLRDDQIRAVAARGGMIGMVGFPAFVASVPRPTLDHFIAHIEHIAALVGTEAIGLGLDYYEGMAGVIPASEAAAQYQRLLATGVWTSEAYPPPPWYYPEGLERPSGFPRLTDGLLRRGFSIEDVHKILGGNFLRVFRQVCG